MKENHFSEPDIASRFEFRTFGQNLEIASRRMARLSTPVPEDMWERFTEEWYVTSKDNDHYNIKIRADKLEVKKLVHKINGLEQWKPIISEAFPVPALCIGLLFEHSAVEIPDLEHRPYEKEELVKMIREHDHLQLTNVRKQRFAYQVNNSICEMAVVLINGAKLFTVSSESEKMIEVLQTTDAIGLHGAENINYIEAIKRVTGQNAETFIN